MEQNLSSLNLTSENYETLKASGFTYVQEVKETENISRWSELSATPATTTALDIYCKNIESGTIYTFNKELDNLLQNEMICGNIMEICGEPGSGKTQICFQLCVNVQLPKWLGGLEGGALYLCTNYNFSTERLKELSIIILNKVLSIEVPAEKKIEMADFSVDTILRNIHHMQINTYDDFPAVLIYLQKWLRNNKIRLLIIDCITPIVQQLDYKEKRHFVYNLLTSIQKMASNHEFVVIITNNITLRTRSISHVYKTAALGEAYFHRINSRIFLERLSDNYFKATLEKSVIRRRSTAIFNLI